MKKDTYIDKLIEENKVITKRIKLILSRNKRLKDESSELVKAVAAECKRKNLSTLEIVESINTELNRQMLFVAKLEAPEKAIK